MVSTTRTSSQREVEPLRVRVSLSSSPSTLDSCSASTQVSGASHEVLPPEELDAALLLAEEASADDAEAPPPHPPEPPRPGAPPVSPEKVEAGAPPLPQAAWMEATTTTMRRSRQEAAREPTAPEDKGGGAEAQRQSTVGRGGTCDGTQILGLAALVSGGAVGVEDGVRAALHLGVDGREARIFAHVVEERAALDPAAVDEPDLDRFLE
jgi:hypothetical protein